MISYDSAVAQNETVTKDNNRLNIFRPTYGNPKKYLINLKRYL